MLSLIYKKFANTLAIRINPFLRNQVHARQFGFIGGRSILDNILAGD